jgi:hypothetical protein
VGNFRLQDTKEKIEGFKIQDSKLKIIWACPRRMKIHAEIHSPSAGSGSRQSLFPKKIGKELLQCLHPSRKTKKGISNIEHRMSNIEVKFEEDLKRENLFSF